MADGIDESLREGLSTAAAQALSEWAEVGDLHYWLDRWLDNGRSGAAVAVVDETDGHSQLTRKLVMKVAPAAAGALNRIEYARHRKAIKEAQDFAARHLSAPVHEPIRVGDGTWITFQTIAGGSFDGLQVLAVMLRRLLDRCPAKPREPVCTAEVIAAACIDVVHGVLHDWAGAAYIPKDKPALTVQEFFDLHLGAKMAPGGVLYERARLHQGDEMLVEGETGPLPNPFAVAQGGYFTDKPFLRPLVGKGHGDLHADNILVRVQPSSDISDYYLIDNALYSTEGVLTSDPAYLVLHIIGRNMDAIALPQRDALIELLIEPQTGPAALVPGWLALIVTGVDREATEWIASCGFASEWRAQTLLSMAACALIFIGRDSIDEKHKPWFLRLAARALAEFVNEHPHTRGDTRRSTPEGSRQVSWIGRLCRDLPSVSEALDDPDGGSSDLDDLRQAALGGLDRAERYREFVRRIGGPDPDTRYGTRGTEGVPEAGEVYVCPLELCDRRERREPGGPVPVCHLPYDDRAYMRQAFR